MINILEQCTDRNSHTEDVLMVAAVCLLQQAGIPPHMVCEGGCDAGCQYSIESFEVDVHGIRIVNNGETYHLLARPLR